MAGVNSKSREEAGLTLITDIEGNSRDDGPGIRSVVFFEGCPLNCVWCHNPESRKLAPELWWDKEKCVAHGECVTECPEGAISRDNPGFINRNACTLCFKCADLCPSKALRRVGQKMSVEDILQKTIHFKSFFDTSGGGVTLSGGEPTLQMDSVALLLRRFKEEGIHTLLETAGLFDFKEFESKILPYVDMIYFDIKLIDSFKHQRYCGVKNERILRNFISLHKKSRLGDFELLPRTPLIPEITDTEANLRGIADFYEQHDVRKTAFLPNNPAWIPKLESLGQTTTFSKYSPIRKLYDEEKEKKIKEYFFDRGIESN